MNESQMKKFEATNEIDVSFGVKGLSRFRAISSCKEER